MTVTLITAPVLLLRPSRKGRRITRTSLPALCAVYAYRILSMLPPQFSSTVYCAGHQRDSVVIEVQA